MPDPRPAAPDPVLTVYVRLYCHLCEEMLGRLGQLRKAHRFALEVHDVDEDTLARKRYGERVPVLVADGREICQYRLDEAAFRAWAETKTTQ